MGGAIFNKTGEVTVRGCSFENNSAVGGAKGSGGYSAYSKPGMGYGGAIFEYVGANTYEDIDYSGNTCSTSGGDIFSWPSMDASP